MHGDWKSADQIEADKAAGEPIDWQKLVVDLWRRVDELQTEVERLKKSPGSN
jgi:hypothetical protein